MSLYSDYILEREGFGCLEDSESFITYKKIDNALYLRDLYVKPEKRNNGKARELVKKVIDIAERMKCERVITTIDKATNNYEINIKGIESEGFEYINGEDFLYYSKEL